MFCPKCKVGMKPLFTSLYCPNECDKPGWAEKRAEKSAVREYINAPPATSVRKAVTFKDRNGKAPFYFDIDLQHIAVGQFCFCYGVIEAINFLSGEGFCGGRDKTTASHHWKWTP